jgi:hypothetical protein
LKLYHIKIWISIYKRKNVVLSSMFFVGKQGNFVKVSKKIGCGDIADRANVLNSQRPYGIMLEKEHWNGERAYGYQS